MVLKVLRGNLLSLMEGIQLNRMKKLCISDIKVEEWSIDPPSLAQLEGNLINQQTRINDFDELFLEVKYKI